MRKDYSYKEEIWWVTKWSPGTLGEGGHKR